MRGVVQPVRRVFLPVVTVAAIVAACEVPFFPAAAVPFQPPKSFVSSWRSMQVCSGRSGHWANVRWYRVPVLPDGLEGAWDYPHHVFLTEFVLSDSVSDFYREYVVKHEILHDLLQTPDHPPAFDECGVR